MSGSEYYDQVALVSAADEALIEEVINWSILWMGFGDTQETLGTEPLQTAQRVCDHPTQRFTLLYEVMDVKV